MPDSGPGRLEQLWQKMTADPVIDQQRQANRANRLVFGQGPAPAQLMLIGEAPGQNEDRVGQPFVGQAGQLLDQTLAEIGLNRQQIYITNLVKFRPAGNRDPEPAEIAAAQAYLAQELEIVQPVLVGCLGRHAARHFYPEIRIGRDNGQAISVNHPSGQGQLTIVPCYHPAACLYNPQIRQPFQAALESIRDKLANPADTNN